jgi:hypothetical protein
LLTAITSRDSLMLAERAAENKDGDAALFMVTLLCGSPSSVGGFQAKSENCGHSEESAIPATQAAHPIRSKIWPRIAVPTKPPAK